MEIQSTPLTKMLNILGEKDVTKSVSPKVLEKEITSTSEPQTLPTYLQELIKMLAYQFHPTTWNNDWDKFLANIKKDFNMGLLEYAKYLFDDFHIYDITDNYEDYYDTLTYDFINLSSSSNILQCSFYDNLNYNDLKVYLVSSFDLQKYGKNHNMENLELSIIAQEIFNQFVDNIFEPNVVNRLSNKLNIIAERFLNKI